MSVIRCATCNLVFKTNEYYKRHLSTIRHIERATNSHIVKFSCVCGRSYSHSQSLCVHRKKCEQHHNTKKTTIPVQVDDNLIIQEMKTELAELRAQIALLLDKNAGITNNNTTNNNNIETQNVNIININAFGNENTDYLDDKAILACIGRVYKSIPSLLEKIHFDPKHPENHNIKITNRKLPYASVMGNNQKWKTVDRKDAIDTMVNNSYNILDDKFKENKDKISVSKQEQFRGFQTRFDTEDKELMKESTAEVDMMVLNGV